MANASHSLDLQSLPTVAVLIVAWNQRELTIACLESVTRLAYPHEKLQIVVVDNNSHDGTPDAIRVRFPAVTVLENNENLGFAEGNNGGLRCILQGAAEYVLLLNNDTIVDTEMVSQLLSVIQSHPNVGIVGPKMLYFEPSDVIWCAGSQLGRYPWISRHLQTGERDMAVSEPPRPVDFICGCGIFLRRAVIEQIGLFDPRFYLYYEETDWCLRARRAGWEILYVPNARLWHRVSATVGGTSPVADYYMNRNAFLFVGKNQPSYHRLVYLSLLLGRQLLAIIAYTVKSHDGARARFRNARLLAVRDAIYGRWGKMGEDVASVCFPRTQ